MLSEFHLKAGPVKSKLWSFSVTVQLWNIHKEHISSQNILYFAGSDQIKFLDKRSHTW